MDDHPHGNQSINALLDDARRRLVETGARNRLIHVNRASSRSNSLAIVNERTPDVFEILRLQGKKMRFAAMGEDAPPEDGDDLILSGGADDSFDAARYRDAILETPLGPEALQRRLLRLFTDARTVEEEQGVNVLFLAMGFLSWYESETSEKRREAPLILLPVDLVRNPRRSDFDLVARDTDLMTNLPLQERLRADFGLSLPDIDTGEDLDPAAYFDAVAERIAGRPRWTIDRDGMQLGFFSFSKLLMLRDLDAGNWPEGALAAHPLLSALLEGGLSPQAPLFAPDERLDPRLAPADLIHVVPADASQTKVIEEVRAGRNLVVQGPPGTGKSQTIANIIAGAAHDGKTVLFVAEKMAALSVVHDRLQKVGLGALCIEVHSRAANKKAFLQELARTLNAGRDAPDMPAPPDALRTARDALNAVAALLHGTAPGLPFTPFSAMAEIAGFHGRGVAPPRLPRDGLAALNDARRAALAADIARYAAALEQSGPRGDHPFRNVRETMLQPADLQRLELALSQAVVALDHLRDVHAAQLRDLDLPLGETFADMTALQGLLEGAAGRPEAARDATEILARGAPETRLREALEAGAAWRAAREAEAETFAEAAFAADTDALRARLAPGVGSFWSRLFGGYRGASAELATLLRGPLPKAPQDRLRLLDTLAEIGRKRAHLEEDESFLKDRLSTVWRGTRTDFAALLAQAAWIDAMRRLSDRLDAAALDRLSDRAGSSPADAFGTALADAGGHLDDLAKTLRLADLEGPARAALDLRAVTDRVTAMRDGMHRYAEWTGLSYLSMRLTQAGLQPVCDALDSGALAPDGAVDAFLYATAEARWQAARDALPELDRLAHRDRHQMVRTFRRLEETRLTETRHLVRAGHLAQLPTGAAGEMGFLRGEMAKKRRHRSIRRIMEAAGSMVQRLKPVFLMSPISIAQYLPPGAVDFDILVIDEASQVRPEDALGAIARCRQIVVVGDQKQLPPTSFFDRVAEEDPSEEEDETATTAKATELESVLSLCEARGLTPGMLEWHYRSRDPSLIAVNNAEFYDHRLILPPSPVQNDPDYGLTFTPVAGVYSSRSRGGGRPGTNRIEADAIAQALAEHARTRPDLSAGVVAFSKSQSDMITEVLEGARRSDPVLEAFLREGRTEDVFVKNIENVQGDERDVILISVGYGPHAAGGRLSSMSFGPVNSEGGERRLNVLFSRARVRCEVFCSFDPGDIDLSRTSRDGPRVLKRFLEFARSGALHQPAPTGGAADSPFEADVAEVIRAMGYPCDGQVGSAGFRIDLGVRHPDRPGQYILAVECDGATYHSALWARERDRLRQDVLEGLGWRFHRIWSTDWFHRRVQEIERLRNALSAARAAGPATFGGANRGGFRPAPEPAKAEAGGDDAAEPVLPPVSSAPAYVRADIRADTALAPHAAPVALLCDLVAQIVAQEGPIHRDEVARRLTAAFGLSRAGSRIRTASDTAIARAVKEGRFVMRDAFCMTPEQEAAPPVRDRSGETSPTTRADYISAPEIRAAAALAIAENGEMSEDDLIVVIARLLGFGRTGQDLGERIRTSLQQRT